MAAIRFPSILPAVPDSQKQVVNLLEHEFFFNIMMMVAKFEYRRFCIQENPANLDIDRGPIDAVIELGDLGSSRRSNSDDVRR